MTTQKHLPTLAILGGTGKEGPGLALRWAMVGYQVIIGSRRHLFLRKEMKLTQRNNGITLLNLIPKHKGFKRGFLR